MTPQKFISHWQASAGSELANSQPFLSGLCDLLDVPQPDVTQQDDSLNAYVFEKRVAFNNGDGTTSPGRIDLYKQDCFVLESKQGSERKAAEMEEALATVTRNRKLKAGTAQRGTSSWEQAMGKARQQAKRYAEALPEWPPFLIVADVGCCFDVYADFSQSGKNYIPFPDPQNYRLRLSDLAKADVRQMLRTIWTEPHALDPTRRSAKVTQYLAGQLAKLAKSLELRKDASGQPIHTPERVAQFLMRCLFTMFAEDVELIGKDSFQQLLESLRGSLVNFCPLVEELWQKMNTGGFSAAVRQQLRQFNGGLFADCEALPLNADQLELLIEAAEAQWAEVEPAIFGTLLERALDPVERHKLGAHYTPRSYVERLVMPTIIEPLRAEWEIAYATAVQLNTDGKTAEAVKTVREFHEQLCELRVLDPACGSGNFLYVSLELMKRLEGEVLNALREFDERQMPLLTINPHQFLGIEVNPRAAAIADLVLWIGYLQWHFRSVGRVTPPEPIIRNFHNIECRDAVLTWDTVEPVFDDEGKPITRWDGRTTKKHPVTGEEVPDETARVQGLRYVNPRKAEWPPADYIVGNPPFIGGWRIRQVQGDGYVQTLWATYPEIPEKADYVMFWWDNAAEAIRANRARRFGFITTNSITQVFQRRVLQRHIEASPNALRIRFAIPDHPWVDSADGAAVRIAMTVADTAPDVGAFLGSVFDERSEDVQVQFSAVHRINPRLTAGAELDSAVAISANRNLCSAGVQLYGAGFILTDEQAKEMTASVATADARHVIRPYLNGRDFMQNSRGVSVIDFFGREHDEARDLHPAAFQRVLDYVKPERDQNRRDSIRRLWWRFGWERPVWRAAVAGLPRYISTPETAKHRVFVFLNSDVLPDNMLTNFALDDAFFLGVFSSRIHVLWSLAAGGRLGVGNDPRYTKSRCFDPFPFPAATEAQQRRIRELGEHLDAHRKRQQAAYPGLTMTGMYNVLEKLRAGEALAAKEQTIHEQGLVSVLRQVHDDLDAAVADAYGWPHDLSDEQILERLVALNHERAEEERRGLVRWLRPDFQKPQEPVATQQKLEIEGEEPVVPAAPAKKEPWPNTLRDQVRAIRETLAKLATPATSDDIANRFTRAPKATVAELLATLVDVGQARQTEDGRYVS
ncbi:MAG: class I SAM-dependent DNA methyltransferase [Planctomycetota bacterium]|nr:class I SAM-dependent DNA methyltransferase [Planctomycetota bacterium]